MEVEELRDRLAAAGSAGPTLRLCEVRWSPTGPTPRERYHSGHIPGAVFVDLERDLSRAQPRGRGGRHPLVAPEELARALARLGIGEETEVVAYDDGGGSVAARLWFQLRLHGHRRVSLLDGGLWAWTRAGLALSTEEQRVPAAALRALVLDRSLLVDRERIAALVRARGSPAAGPPLLLDARAPERYRGEVEAIDPVAGHIPGAVNAPFARSLRAADDPRWRTPAELRALLEPLGAAPGREVIASCGSGVTACHTLVALDLAGLGPGKLYAGSWSDWISEPGAEVARGSEPG